MKLRNVLLTHVAFFAAVGATFPCSGANWGIQLEWPVRRRPGRRRLGSFRAKRFRAPAIAAASAASAWPCDQTVGRRKWLIWGKWWNRWRDGRLQLANGSVGTRRRGRLLLGQHHRKFSDVRILRLLMDAAPRSNLSER